MLSMYRCQNCHQLPSLGQLPSLQHLRIVGFDELERIGDEFYKNGESSHEGTPFRSLESLIFRGMHGWRDWHIPHEFDGFPKLKMLDISDCPVLSGDLPAHLPALEQLTIWMCEELACSLPRAPKLQELIVSSSACYETVEPHQVVVEETLQAMSVLEFLPHVQSPSLQCLKIQKCSSSISISGDYLPDSLQVLIISDCSELTFSKPLQHKSLREIHVSQCDSVTLFPLGALPNLKKLEISDCSEMDSFGEECLPPSLTSLRINNCKKLASWMTSKGLQSEGLNHLSLEQWNDVKSFPREGCLPSSIQSLELSHFSNLETLECEGLQHLTSLKQLTIEECPKLENIMEQRLPASIEKLYIMGQCPLRSKLEETKDHRIQFQTVQEDEFS
ncbi:hypothetical protein PIB30_083454 [Stylosanthes scabra]|uniref:Uncharacterized protein n=1 Tax=Stylosanthes scabra TaxID=79078 RepID=A0ABU6ZQY3_9FABA|nr:hypothetical protein [Stylosanthes scabra]